MKVTSLRWMILSYLLSLLRFMFVTSVLKIVFFSRPWSLANLLMVSRTIVPGTFVKGLGCSK